ncbi:MAG: hypothetical protein EON97_01295 [Chitinophagaceae bacterium]|nr:MAG: hypothetical protein EON97_01295 [Chitinophagaceae bacterium]
MEMINLLPTEYKNELRAARMNVVLMRYNIITAGAVVFLILACGAFFTILLTNKSAAEETNRINEAKAQSYDSTKTAAEEYRSNLATAKQILSTEVNYTDVVFGITELLPAGVVLSDINLSKADFGNQTTVTAQAKNYTAVTKLKESFQNSKVFSNASFLSVTDTSTEGAASAYPLNVTLSVKVSKEIK